MIKLYFVRHGQTALSRDNRFCGASDPPLTSEGQEMAQVLGEYYEKVDWKAIYASPMLRTRQTSAPLARATKHKLITDPGLKEISYGKWEGHTTEVVRRRWPEDYLKWTADPGWNAPTGGETANQIAARALPVIGRIRKEHRTGNIMVISHKATIRIILCALLGIDVGRFRYRLGAPVASVSIVEFSTHHGPLLKVLGDTSHLPERLRTLEGT